MERETNTMSDSKRLMRGEGYPNMVRSMREYIKKVVGVTGHKVLLLDQETVCEDGGAATVNNQRRCHNNLLLHIQMLGSSCFMFTFIWNHDVDKRIRSYSMITFVHVYVCVYIGMHKHRC